MEIGIKNSCETLVCSENTARAMGSGALEVFATPAMIALMEKAAMECVAPFLEAGQGTVGIKMDVSHVAASPVGMKVRAEAELTAIEKRTLTFKVSAYAGDELIGEGTHQRAVILNERFMEKAQAKLK